MCWITGRPLNRHLPARVFDIPPKKTGEDGAERAGETRGHTLAFIRLEYAAIVAAPLYLFIALDEAGFL